MTSVDLRELTEYHQIHNRITNRKTHIIKRKNIRAKMDGNEKPIFIS